MASKHANQPPPKTSLKRHLEHNQELYDIHPQTIISPIKNDNEDHLRQFHTTDDPSLDIC